jgi:hypothetical protein
MVKKYIEVGGPTDAELKKIEKEQKDIYTMPLKELFKVDEDIEVQRTTMLMNDIDTVEFIKDKFLEGKV